MAIDARAYLARIGYEGSVDSSLDTLHELAVLHLQHVPFETFDIHMRIPIALDLVHLQNKIVAERRGGYCYELNYLFAGLLRKLGFDVELLAANVLIPGSLGRPFDHLTLCVNLPEGSHLVDVGFGDGFHAPLELRDGASGSFGQHDFVVSKNDLGYRLTCRRDEQVIKELQFERKPREIADFEQMNVFQSTNPASWWTRELVAAKATPTGRISLVGQQLTRRDKDRKVVRKINREQWLETLFNEFGINISYIPTPRAKSIDMRLRYAGQILLHKTTKLLRLH